MPAKYLKSMIVTATLVVPVLSSLSLSAQTLKMALMKTTQPLQTPRGAKIVIDIFNASADRVLLLAPGQGCSPRHDLYDSLALEAVKNDVKLVRLYWAYCLTEPTGGPNSLKEEIEDFQTALHYIREDLSVPAEKIWLGGKSLGSFVSYEVFQKENASPGLILLTPVCTQEDEKTGASTNSMNEFYPGLKNEKRPVLLVQGDQDGLCLSRHLDEYLKEAPAHFRLLRVPGNHGFGAGSEAETASGLKRLSEWIFQNL